MRSVALTSLSHGASCGCKASNRRTAAGRPWPAAAKRSGASGRGWSGPPPPPPYSGSEKNWRSSRPADFFNADRRRPVRLRSGHGPNAQPDVYAMGGAPLTALNLVAFPLERLDGEILRPFSWEAPRSPTRRTAQSSLATRSTTPSRNTLAVTGIVDPAAMLTNATARASDVLVLTKPLGACAISAAHKRGAPRARLACRSGRGDGGPERAGDSTSAGRRSACCDRWDRIRAAMARARRWRAGAGSRWRFVPATCRRCGAMVSS